MIALAESGMPMVCVTYETGFARQVADPFVFMDRGEIVESRPPAELFANPKTDPLKPFLSQILRPSVGLARHLFLITDCIGNAG